MASGHTDIGVLVNHLIWADDIIDRGHDGAVKVLCAALKITVFLALEIRI